MAKTRIMWLSRDGYKYIIWETEPEWDRYSDSWNGSVLDEFCDSDFEVFFPSLKLRKNTCCKLRLTQLKNGIKLEKVK